MDTVFFSWQSDLDEFKTNRGIIKDALKKSLAKVRADSSIISRPEFDEATRATKGAAHIALSIFRKIRQAQAFVCDVTLVTKQQPFMPNGNVLVELGYAARALGWSRVIPVFNQAYGKPGELADPKAELPFDIGFRSMILYSLSPTDAQDAAKRKVARDSVRDQLVHRLTSIIGRLEMRPPVIDLSKVPYVFHYSSGSSTNALEMVLRIARGVVFDVACGVRNGNNYEVNKQFQLLDANVKPWPTLKYSVTAGVVPALTIFIEFTTMDRRRFRVEQTASRVENG